MGMNMSNFGLSSQWLDLIALSMTNSWKLHTNIQLHIGDRNLGTSTRCCLFRSLRRIGLVLFLDIWIVLFNSTFEMNRPRDWILIFNFSLFYQSSIYLILMSVHYQYALIQEFVFTPTNKASLIHCFFLLYLVIH